MYSYDQRSRANSFQVFMNDAEQHPNGTKFEPSQSVTFFNKRKYSEQTVLSRLSRSSTQTDQFSYPTYTSRRGSFSASTSAATTRRTSVDQYSPPSSSNSSPSVDNGAFYSKTSGPQKTKKTAYYSSATPELPQSPVFQPLRTQKQERVALLHRSRASHHASMRSRTIGSISEIPSLVEYNPERKLKAPQSPMQISPTSKRTSVTSTDPSLAEADVATAVREPDSIGLAMTFDGVRHHSLTANPHEILLEELETCVVTATPKARPDQSEETLRKAGRRKIVLQKSAVQASQVLVNGFFIFTTWWWSKYFYVLLPFITATVVLNVAMVVSVIVAKAKHTVWPERKIVPEEPEQYVMLIPCYNETREELLKSLDSLCDQVDVDQHRKSIMIICDGKVRGPGMEKTTADYLLEDILVDKTETKVIKGAYLAWDQQFMDVVIQRGHYRGLPYFLVVKQQNQGKRDGLIVIRSFLYNFNERKTYPTVIFSNRFFAEMASWLLESGITHVDHLIGMDADTVFDEKCVWSLLQESRYPKTVGVCGYVAVDYSAGNWNIWRLYQSAEYTIAQTLRRLHQSTVTKKVSCLPGCCQLLKICEETCGQEVLVEKFGYCPTVSDSLLNHIRATASEDRNHVCHMLSARPNSETRQALAARAKTDVPHSWSVFLSQRRRWTLGATSNDLMLVTAPGVQWFERILATVNVITWFLNPFILASLAGFILACIVVPAWLVLCFVSVMAIPVVYYLCVPLWLCKNFREMLQFWLGCACYIFLGPFINISVLLYASWNMDSFGWGKTRKVVSEDTLVELTFHEKVSMETVESAVTPDPVGIATDRVTAAMDEEKSIGT